MPSREQDLTELGLSDSDGEHGYKKIRRAYLELSKSKHPDKGGSKEAFQALSNAYQRLTTDGYRYPRSSIKETNRRQRRPGPSGDDTRSRKASSSSIGSEKSKTTSHHQERNQQEPQQQDSNSSQNENGNDNNDDDDEANFWSDEYFHFFRRAWNNHYDQDERFYDAYFTRWEATTRQQRARQRYQNVKDGYDYRDKKVDASSKCKCMFCGKNKPISKLFSKLDAEEHGLNWTEYSRQRNEYCYANYKSCWACKNSHTSVLTRKQALAKFTDKQKPALENSVFVNLRKMGRSFHHRPVTSYAEVTLNSEYFWYPDLEQEALAHGWRPRGTTHRLQVPWVPKTNESLQLQSPGKPSRKRKKSTKAAPGTPKARKKAATANLVTASASQQSNRATSKAAELWSSTRKLQPKKLFEAQKEATHAAPRTSKARKKAATATAFVGYNASQQSNRAKSKAAKFLSSTRKLQPKKLFEAQKEAAQAAPGSPKAKKKSASVNLVTASVGYNASQQSNRATSKAAKFLSSVRKQRTKKLFKEQEEVAPRTPKSRKKSATANASGTYDTSQQSDLATSKAAHFLSSTRTVQPKKLFEEQKEAKTSNSPGNGGDWRVSGAMDY